MYRSPVRACRTRRSEAVCRAFTTSRLLSERLGGAGAETGCDGGELVGGVTWSGVTLRWSSGDDVAAGVLRLTGLLWPFAQEAQDPFFSLSQLTICVHLLNLVEAASSAALGVEVVMCIVSTLVRVLMLAVTVPTQEGVALMFPRRAASANGRGLCSSLSGMRGFYWPL